MRNLILLTILIISFSACYKDYDDTYTETEIDIEEIIIETGLTGRVFDSNGDAVTDLELVVQEQAYQVSNAFFYHHLTEAHKLGQLIYIQKDRQIIGLANALLLENDVNYLDLHTFPEPTKQSVPLSNADVTLTNNIQLNFDASTLIDLRGASAGGDVSIMFSFFSDKTLVDQLGYFGYNSNGDLLTLDKGEVFYYGFEDVNQNKLFPSELSVFSLNIQTDNKVLFHLDESSNVWRQMENFSSDEELKLNKSGYFMLAETAQAVYAEGDITKENIAVSFLDYSSTDNSSDKIISSKSTANGRWAGVYKADTELSIDIISPCKDLIEEVSLDVKSTNKLNYAIEVDDDSNYISVNTKIINCEGNVEESPALTISNGNGQDFIYVFQKGNIDTWLPICTEEFGIGGYSLDNANEGPIVDWSIHQTSDIIFLSDCPDFKDGFSYLKIRDDEQIYPPLQVTTENMKTLLEEEESRFRIDFLGTESRTYAKEEVRKVFINDMDFGDYGYQCNCDSSLDCGIEEFDVTHFDEEPDGWVRITFSGEIFMGTLNQDPIVAGGFPVEGIILTKK